MRGWGLVRGLRRNKRNHCVKSWQQQLPASTVPLPQHLICFFSDVPRSTGYKRYLGFVTGSLIKLTNVTGCLLLEYSISKTQELESGGGNPKETNLSSELSSWFTCSTEPLLCVWVLQPDSQSIDLASTVNKLYLLQPRRTHCFSEASFLSPGQPLAVLTLENLLLLMQEGQDFFLLPSSSLRLSFALCWAPLSSPLFLYATQMPTPSLSFCKISYKLALKSSPYMFRKGRCPFNFSRSLYMGLCSVL